MDNVPVQKVNLYRSNKLLGLSYSGLQLLSSCPRKWLLRKLSEVPKEDSVHTYFGKCFGEGIQGVMQNIDPQKMLWKMFLEWKMDLSEVGKANKGFFQAVHGVRMFETIWNTAYAECYELAYITHPETGEVIPAVELGFRINLPGGYYYIGYVDAVLRDKRTNQLVVLELKTTGARYLDEATYKNSNQALGYSVVLDSISKLLGADRSGYTVLYLVYQTDAQEFTPMPFPKSYKQRARFLKELIMDAQMLEFYKEQEHFKIDGGGCVGFGSRCEFYGMCELDPEQVVSMDKLAEEPFIRGEIHFTFEFADLINDQESLL